MVKSDLQKIQNSEINLDYSSTQQIHIVGFTYAIAQLRKYLMKIYKSDSKDIKNYWSL